MGRGCGAVADGRSTCADPPSARRPSGARAPPRSPSRRRQEAGRAGQGRACRAPPRAHGASRAPRTPQRQREEKEEDEDEDEGVAEPGADLPLHRCPTAAASLPAAAGERCAGRRERPFPPSAAGAGRRLQRPRPGGEGPRGEGPWRGLGGGRGCAGGLPPRSLSARPWGASACRVRGAGGALGRGEPRSGSLRRCGSRRNAAEAARCARGCTSRLRRSR